MTSESQPQPANDRSNAVLVYEHQLDDFTVCDTDECLCQDEETSIIPEPAIFTPHPHSSDSLEYRCGDCGALVTDVYWSNMDDLVDRRERKD